MSRRISVEILGDSSSVERAFRRSSTAGGAWNRDIQKVGRGALVATVGFRGLGRSLAFASGSFLAFGTATEAVRKSIDAAETSEKALRSLAAQAKATYAR